MSAAAHRKVTVFAIQFRNSVLTHHTLGFSNKYSSRPTWGPCAEQWKFPLRAGQRGRQRVSFNCTPPWGHGRLDFLFFSVWLAGQTEVDRLSLCILLEGEVTEGPWLSTLLGRNTKLRVESLPEPCDLRDLEPGQCWGWSVPCLSYYHYSLGIFPLWTHLLRIKLEAIEFVNFCGWRFWLHRTYQVPPPSPTFRGLSWHIRWESASENLSLLSHRPISCYQRRFITLFQKARSWI